MACAACHVAKTRCDKKEKAEDEPCSRCANLSICCVPHVSRQGQRKRQSTGTGTSGGGGGACEACHIAATKCDKGNPCSRCVRLGLAPCVPYEGSGTQMRKRKKKRVPTKQSSSEDLQLAQELSLDSNHYGLNYLIRSWIAFAFTRRSFKLLKRALNVALKAGVTMDDVFCETEMRRGMDFLHSVLMLPEQEQRVVGPPLQWTDVPFRLLQACQCASSPPGENSDRWIWIREMRRGVSRYLVTDAFAESVCSLSEINKTLQENSQSVADLFLPDKTMHTRAFAHQISMHDNENKEPESCRVSNVQVKTRTAGVSKVTQFACLDIVSLDHAFFYIEYVPEDRRRESDNVNLDELILSEDLELLLSLMEEGAT